MTGIIKALRITISSGTISNLPRGIGSQKKYANITKRPTAPKEMEKRNDCKNSSVLLFL